MKADLRISVKDISRGKNVKVLLTGKVLRPDRDSLDRVLPRSRGGKDEWGNLVWHDLSRVPRPAIPDHGSPPDATVRQFHSGSRRARKNWFAFVLIGIETLAGRVLVRIGVQL